MDADEREVYYFLKARRTEYISIRDICRSAGNKKRVRYNPEWAVPAVGRDNAGLRADFILETDIRDFSAVYDSPTGPPLVSVVVHVELIKIPEHKIVGQRSITRRQRAAANAVPDVVRAFDAALGGVVEEVVRWAVTNTALSGRRGALFWPRFVRAG